MIKVYLYVKMFAGIYFSPKWGVNNDKLSIRQIST